MMFSCSVWSPKGGSGKSTIALTLAAFFAAEDSSRKVLLVDADAQQSARTWEAQARQMGNTLPFDVSASDARASSYDVVVYDHAPGLAGSALKGQVVLMPVLPASFFDSASTIRGEAELRAKGKRVLLLPNRVETNHASDIAFLAQGFVGRPFLKKRKAAYQATVARGLTIYGADKSGIRGLREARVEFERVVDALVDLAAA
ncbi:TPA: AAA family ATPase [Burkholderia vietnamiensis]|uniref:nucleotide-binding protein n=1 Tax=Burkholderia cepacia TaxID=292 RepID=UPI00264DF816|nr:AAA family ATPase [Burkholderia cepacia]MDN7857973.1 AAA family ATPase [Burkholderia cepacia]HDR9169538.1 AAA family ATPase [Burkholderia vietnamiensis]